MRVVAEAHERTLRQKIGGRWSVSWQGYLIELPISVFFVLTSVPAFQTFDTIGYGLLVSLLGYLATGAVLWVSSVTVLRNRRAHPAPILVVVLVSGVAWALRSGIVAASLAWAGLPSTTPVLARLAFGFVLGAVSVPLIAWILDNLADFKDRREEALSGLVEEQVSADRQAAYVDAMRTGLVQQVHAALDEARVDFDALDLSAQSMPPEALDAVERVSKNAVRRISRDTWQEAEHAARLRVRDVLRVAATTAPFRLWSLMVLVPFWIVVAARVAGWSTALLAGLAGLGYVSVAVVLANRLVPRARRPLAAYGSAVLLMGGVGAITFVVLSGRFGGDPGPLQLSVLATIMVMIVVPVTGLARAMGDAEGRTLRALDVSISAAELRREVLVEQEARLRREIAIALHGTVGANLTAATMRLRQAIDRGDVDAAAEALAESRRLLDVDLHTLLLRQHSDVRAALAELSDQWFGLVQITVEVEPDVELSPASTQAVMDVVTEGISNAVGHGGATAIEVCVSQCAGGVRVVLDDDGHIPGGGNPGLGSRMLDEHARGRWERQAQGSQGSRLIIEVAR